MSMIPKTDGKGLNLLYDRDLVLSASQVLAGSEVVSTNTINLGSIDMPKGKPIKVNVFIEALVGTLLIKVCGDITTPAAADVLFETTIGAGLLGVVSFVIPPSAEDNLINIFYTAGTSGTVSSNITAEV